MTMRLLSWRMSFRGFNLLRSRRHSTTTDASSSPSSEAGARRRQVQEVADDMVDTIIGLQLKKEMHSPALLNALSLENASTSEKRKIEKLSIVKKFRRSESDTGSPEVQSKF